MEKPILEKVFGFKRDHIVVAYSQGKAKYNLWVYAYDQKKGMGRCLALRTWLCDPAGHMVMQYEIGDLDQDTQKHLLALAKGILQDD